MRDEDLQRAVTDVDRLRVPSFELFVPPIRDIRLHDERTKEDKPLGLLFVNASDPSFLKTYRARCEHKFHLRFYPMYDSRKHSYIEVPDKQMNLFRMIRPDEIAELYVLSKPFVDYSLHNDRYVILEAPFENVEGYRINLHKGKSIAIEIGGMAFAVRANSKFKLARIFDKKKDKIFAHQQPERLVCHLIACLQVYGFRDDAYGQLVQLLELCHSCEDDFASMEANLKMRAKDADEAAALLYGFVRSLDAVTAGYIVSLSSHLYSERNNINVAYLLRPRRILPFLTPTSGVIGKLLKPYVTVDHKDCIEIIKPVTVSERIIYENEEKSRTEKVQYFAHIGIAKADGAMFCDLSAFYMHLAGIVDEKVRSESLQQLLTNDSPLYAILNGEDEDFSLDATHGLCLRHTAEISNLIESSKSIETYMSDIDKLISKAKSIILHMFESSRLAEWRPLLSDVWVHAD